jgi:hypothetical protein
MDGELGGAFCDLGYGMRSWKVRYRRRVCLIEEVLFYIARDGEQLC